MIDTAFLFLKGTITTVLLWMSACIISFVFGLLVGTVRCSHLRLGLISYVLDGIVLLLRGIPLYAQLMIAYFVIPQIIGINLSAFTTGVITLGLCSGAYTSEIIRGSLNSVSQGQWKASHVLGYSLAEQLRYIIMPQMLTIALPSLINEYVMALKSTALLASIGTLELTKVGLNVMYRSGNPLTVCFTVAGIYLVLTSIVSLLGNFLERNYYAQRS